MWCSWIRREPVLSRADLEVQVRSVLMRGPDPGDRVERMTALLNAFQLRVVQDDVSAAVRRDRHLEGEAPAGDVPGRCHRAVGGFERGTREDEPGTRPRRDAGVVVAGRRRIEVDPPDGAIHPVADGAE